MCGKSNCGCNLTELTKGEKGDSGIQGTPGTNGTNGADGGTGPQGIQGEIGHTGDPGFPGTPGTDAFKFIKEFTSIFDGEIITITQEELTSCTSVPTGCLFAPAVDNFASVIISVYYLDSNIWTRIDNLDLITTSINNISGDISVALLLPPPEFPVTVRVVIIG